MDQSAMTLFARAPLDPPHPAPRSVTRPVAPPSTPRTVLFEDEVAPGVRSAEPGEARLPDWLIPVAGGVVAALLGLMLGGALAL